MMRQWSDQWGGTASHIRNNQNPENAVVQSTPIPGSWPSLSQRGNVVGPHAQHPLAVGDNILSVSAAQTANMLAQPKSYGLTLSRS